MAGKTLAELPNTATSGQDLFGCPMIIGALADNDVSEKLFIGSLFGVIFDILKTQVGDGAPDGDTPTGGYLYADRTDSYKLYVFDSGDFAWHAATV